MVAEDILEGALNRISGQDRARLVRGCLGTMVLRECDKKNIKLCEDKYRGCRGPGPLARIRCGAAPLRFGCPSVYVSTCSKDVLMFIQRGVKTPQSSMPPTHCRLPNFVPTQSQRLFKSAGLESKPLLAFRGPTWSPLAMNPFFERCCPSCLSKLGTGFSR